MSTIAKLNSWLQAGLITPAQHATILDFEARRPQGVNWWLYSFMILGAAIIGLGIISLIAANWADIPDGVKLGMDFSLLAALAAAIYWQYPNRRQGAWFETLLTGFMLLCLASIGLIAQIYHVSGKWHYALLFWAGITSLLSLYARSLFARFLWVTLFLHGLIWSVAALTGDSFRLEETPSILLLTPLLTALLYYLATHVKPLYGYAGSLFFWFQLSAIAALAFADITRSSGEMDDYRAIWYLPAYLTAAILAVGVLLSRNYRLLNRLLLLAALALLLLYYHPDLLFTGAQRYALFGFTPHADVSFWQADDIRAPFLTLLILFLYAVHAGNRGYQRTFSLVTFLIGLRFVVLYFQAMGGLAATGVGLIISGALIIAMAWLWYKGRGRFRQWAKELQA